MATPHVAGIVAYLIGKDGNVSPAAMASKLNTLSVSGAISGVREYPFWLVSSEFAMAHDQPLTQLQEQLTDSCKSTRQHRRCNLSLYHAADLWMPLPSRNVVCIFPQRRANLIVLPENQM